MKKMIEPFKIKDAFKKVEDENYKFRTFLRLHANPDKLDKQFSRLHKELFQNYDCTKCRNCCREYSALFTEGEIKKVANFLKMDENEFRSEYIKEESGELLIRKKPCRFLQKDGKCMIQEVKPSACREYPFTDKPERRGSLIDIIESTGICPVVFEIYERLKKEYRYRTNK